MQSTNLQSFNNLTWDVMLTPQSYWLFMRDIDEEASLSLKNVIYNWNINLTYDLFQELQELQETKYDFIEPTWAINGNRMWDISMTWKESWLYMNHLRLWYWDWTQWKSYIANNWEFFFKWNDNNYIHWNGSTLKIEWDITARNWHFTWNITSDATITWWTFRWWLFQSTDFVNWVSWWRLSNVWLEMFTDKLIWLRWWSSLNVSSWWTSTEIKDDWIYFSQVWVWTSELYIDTDWDTYNAFTWRLKLNNTREVFAMKSYSWTVITPNWNIVIELEWIEYQIPVRSV